MRNRGAFYGREMMRMIRIGGQYYRVGIWSLQGRFDLTTFESFLYLVEL